MAGMRATEAAVGFRRATVYALRVGLHTGRDKRRAKEETSRAVYRPEAVALFPLVTSCSWVPSQNLAMETKAGWLV